MNSIDKIIKDAIGSGKSVEEQCLILGTVVSSMLKNRSTTENDLKMYENQIQAYRKRMEEIYKNKEGKNE